MIGRRYHEHCGDRGACVSRLPVRRWLLWIIFGALALFFLALLLFATDSASERQGFAVAIAIMLAIGLAVTPLVWYPRVEVSESGIRVRQVGWSVSAPWEHIAAVWASSPGRGLITREAATMRGKGWLWFGLRWQHLGSFSRDVQAFYEHYVPLEPFWHYFRRGELERILAEHGVRLASDERV